MLKCLYSLKDFIVYLYKFELLMKSERAMDGRYSDYFMSVMKNSYEFITKGAWYTKNWFYHLS